MKESQPSSPWLVSFWLERVRGGGQVFKGISGSEGEYEVNLSFRGLFIVSFTKNPDDFLPILIFWHFKRFKGARIT